ncbi:MAG: copper chaperone PCu(A)C [Porticoccaceae bacterium]
MKLSSVVIVLLLLSGGVVAGDIAISDGRVRETIPGQTVSAGYLRIVNKSSDPCVLHGVSSAAAGKVEVHEHRHQDGKMSMREVVNLAVDAKASVLFEPGGYHLMLLNLSQPLAKGDTVAVNFDFGDCGAVMEKFPVVAIGD